MEQPEKVVVVKPKRSKKEKVAIEQPPEQHKTPQASLDLGGAFSMLRDLGFEISHPKLMNNKSQPEAQVNIKAPAPQEQKSEVPKVVKTKKRIERPIPKKKESDNEDEDEGDEPIAYATTKVEISHKERKEMNLPPPSKSVAQASARPAQAVNRPIVQAVATAPVPVRAGYGANPLARKNTPFGLPY
jgi:hypothetical protein